MTNVMEELTFRNFDMERDLMPLIALLSAIQDCGEDAGYEDLTAETWELELRKAA